MANGSKGVIANIPSIKSMAYFNTIAMEWFEIRQKLKSNLNLYYGAKLPQLPFTEGDNAIFY
jgi:hypothetical protein